MTSGLENWLAIATRRLSAESALRVRAEIEAHYDAAVESAISEGAAVPDADAAALAALGDAKRANASYRNVLLTAREARALHEISGEAHAVCSWRWRKRVVIGAPLLFLTAAVLLLIEGSAGAAADLALAGTGIGVVVGAAFLPIYTPGRARFFRYGKWVVFVGIFIGILGSEAAKSSWLLISSLTPLMISERIRASIRKKLPVSRWPKHLYL